MPSWLVSRWKTSSTPRSAATSNGIPDKNLRGFGARLKVPCMQVPPFSLSQQLADLGQELDAAALRVLHSGQYIGGSEIQAFERSFAEAVGTAHAVGCNSGTDALVLALRGLGIGSGDEVITASFSFFATA